jgi:membrane-associated phospholipid phosphatase
MPRHVHLRPELGGALASATAFAALARRAAVANPMAIDRALHDLAAASYNRKLELLQLPIEIGGLPGVYIPAAVLAAWRLRKRGIGGGKVLVGAACLGWLTLRLSRLLYERTRPPRPPHRGPKAESSFPSGHTTGVTAVAFAAAIVLARQGLLSRRSAWLLGIGAPLATAINRVYVREHWATDVLGGWLLGAAVGLAVLGTARR